MYEPLSAHRLSIALCIVNVIGAAIYVGAVSRSWAIPEERAQGVHSVTGEPFVWAAFAIPILAGFGLLNLLWGLNICLKKKWQEGYIWLTTPLIWIVAILIDFAHH